MQLSVADAMDAWLHQHRGLTATVAGVRHFPRGEVSYHQVEAVVRLLD